MITSGYIQHEPITPQKLDIDTLDNRHHKDLYFKLKGEERETLDINFGMYPKILKSKYLDVYEGIYAEMVYANKFNDNSDLSMTYGHRFEIFILVSKIHDNVDLVMGMKNIFELEGVIDS